MVWLTPKLVERGKQVVYQYLKDQKGREDAATKKVLSSTQFIILHNQMKTQDIPKEDKTHILYVVLELVKLLGLGQCLVSLASLLYGDSVIILDIARDPILGQAM